jgi:hypothetical protein
MILALVDVWSKIREPRPLTFENIVFEYCFLYIFESVLGVVNECFVCITDDSLSSSKRCQVWTSFQAESGLNSLSGRIELHSILFQLSSYLEFEKYKNTSLLVYCACPPTSPCPCSLLWPGLLQLKREPLGYLYPASLLKKERTSTYREAKVCVWIISYFDSY